MSKESKRICRQCAHKDVCRWFPEVSESFEVKHEEFRSSLQIELERLFATYCNWYKEKGR